MLLMFICFSRSRPTRHEELLCSYSKVKFVVGPPKEKEYYNCSQDNL